MTSFCCISCKWTGHLDILSPSCHLFYDFQKSEQSINITLSEKIFVWKEYQQNPFCSLLHPSSTWVAPYSPEVFIEEQSDEILNFQIFLLNSCTVSFIFFPQAIFQLHAQIILLTSTTHVKVSYLWFEMFHRRHRRCEITKTIPMSEGLAPERAHPPKELANWTANTQEGLAKKGGKRIGRNHNGDNEHMEIAATEDSEFLHTSRVRPILFLGLVLELG
ncbi:hypothetical protein TSUD_369130 [Trifolium subterraneum]|uniref:Uncharacterized protein n=1 Tax=Trifolium subterraneum TaxID=3900 RepID=A0A2Z6PBD7_TRISU|nr:hypothetical protein TSUD_369130 [Trifolium subterraneum]